MECALLPEASGRPPVAPPQSPHGRGHAHGHPAKRLRRDPSAAAAVTVQSREAREADVTQLLRTALRSTPEDPPEDLAYREGAEFLRALGVEQRGDITQVLDIAMNPNSLFVTMLDQQQAFNPHARILSRAELEAVRDFLLAEGLTREELAKVVLEHPPVLCYDPAARLAPFFAFLRELGVASPPRTVARRPVLLGLDVAAARRIAGYLREEAGRSVEEVEELLGTTI